MKSLHKIFSRFLIISCVVLLCISAPHKSEATLLYGSGSGAGLPAPSKPSFATTWGYNTNTFWDDFLNLGTIDVNNTLQSGYNWYMTDLEVPPGSPRTVNANSVSTSGSNLTINETGNGGWLTTAGFTGGNSFVGKTFKNGGYFEATYKFNIANKQANPSFPIPSGPAFWFIDEQIQIDISAQSSTNLPKAELDVFEYLAVRSFGDAALNVWSNYNSLTTLYQYDYVGPDNAYNTFHSYGVLWVPASKNSGTGFIQFYLDRVAVGTPFTYTSSDPYYVIDTSTLGLSMLIGSQPNYPIVFDNVQVWQ